MVWVVAPPSLAASAGVAASQLARAAEEHLLAVLAAVHYASPVVLVFVFFIAVGTRSAYIHQPKGDDGQWADRQAQQQQQPRPANGPGGKPLPDELGGLRSVPERPEPSFSRSQKVLFQWLVGAVGATLVASAVNVVVHVLAGRREHWWCGEAAVIYIVGSFFVYALFLISLVDNTSGPNVAHLATWCVALVLETVLLAYSLRLYPSRHRDRQLSGLGHGAWLDGMTAWEIADVSIDIFRIVFILAFIGLFFSCRRRQSWQDRQVDRCEQTALLAEAGHQHDTAANGALTAYGTASPPAKKGPAGMNGSADAPAGWSRPDTIPARSWWDYLRGYSVFFPYLWPSKERRLQIVVFVCFIIVILQRVVNVLAPNQVGVITDELSGENGRVRMPWAGILFYITLRLLQGSQGILGAIRAVLWTPVSQYSYRELSIASFEHVHSLSLDFHLGKRTGEVLSALGKGSSINNFLEQVTFQMVPMVVDLFVAIAYLLIAFDPYYALVVAIVLFFYIYITVRMAQWRVDVRRVMVNADREQDAVKNDSMISYETVKYFNAEQYEFGRYRNAVERYQQAEYKVIFTLNIMNITQNVIFVLGVMVASFIAAYQVTTGKLRVGKFVALLTYMAQLQQPLNFFGTFYRSIQSSMINAERLLELFKEQPTVVDSATAQSLGSCDGDIRFEDVHFGYDGRKKALQGLSFRCPSGTTTALVGESGGGKSTVFRLLFRFYNSQEGEILVDGRNVQDVTINSLRQHIGVVPQDTVLFNESLMYNLKYANPEATDEDVYAACEAASIHHRILSFPDGYDTRVGERGLRLSGGEKQRVAIARTIIKNARIILLDEATAALDTETEEHIQEALTKLSHGRTMLVIAHRLSTITQADQILVLHEGRVAESGSHEELLARKGRYSMMWRKQVRAQRAAEEARVLKDKADRLRRESKDGTILNTADGEHESASASAAANQSSGSESGSSPRRGARAAEDQASYNSSDGDEPVHGHAAELDPAAPPGQHVDDISEPSSQRTYVGRGSQDGNAGERSLVGSPYRAEGRRERSDSHRADR